MSAIFDRHKGHLNCAIVSLCLSTFLSLPLLGNLALCDTLINLRVAEWRKSRAKSNQYNTSYPCRESVILFDIVAIRKSL
jgi:hypothetical protein